MNWKNVEWRNLRECPPKENCNICLKVGDDYETYRFRLTGSTWCLFKFIGHQYSPERIPEEAEYIILDNIE